MAAAFVILVAGMQAAQPLLVPFLLSLFITVIATPPLFYLKSKGFPEGVAIFIVVLGIALVGLLLGWMVGDSLNDFTSNLPKYQERLQSLSQGLLHWLNQHDIRVDQQALLTFLDPGKALAMAGKLLRGLGGVLAQSVFILITVIFMLLEARLFSAKIIAITENPQAAQARIENITDSIKQYMSIKTSTSLLTGVVVTLVLLIIGVDYPVLWGLVAFLFNFVPNIGSIIAAIPAVLLALIQLGAGAALWTAAGYLAINSLVGNVIEPRFMGKGLGLSPLVVFISLVFWGWVLGPVGMFLSVPLTVTLKIILESSSESRGVAFLLGENKV